MGPDGVLRRAQKRFQKGLRRGPDEFQMGSSRWSRLRCPRFVQTRVKIETRTDNRSGIYSVKILSKSNEQLDYEPEFSTSR